MEIHIDENLWSTSIAPEGILERWRAAQHTVVKRGQAVAEVRIEDSLHEITAPVGGTLFHLAPAGGLVEPGSVIGRLTP